jgi:hypothetical protein
MELLRMFARHRLFPLLGVVALAGCPQPKPSDTVASFQATANSVVLCRTTEAELRLQLGEPTREGLLHRSRILTWIIPGTSSARYLSALLDEQRIVTDIYWDIPPSVPWVPTSQCAGHPAESGPGSAHE